MITQEFVFAKTFKQNWLDRKMNRFLRKYNLLPNNKTFDDYNEMMLGQTTFKYGGNHIIRINVEDIYLYAEENRIKFIDSVSDAITHELIHVEIHEAGYGKWNKNSENVIKTMLC